MARYNIDEIINNANSQKKKKKRYDIDEILNNANNISKSSSITKTNISTPNIRLNNEDKNFWGNVGNMSNKMLQEAIKVEEQRNFAKELLKNSISNVKNINLGDGFVKASSAFDDGYQFGDVSKTILSTTGDVALNVGKGIMNIGEGIGDLATYGIAGIADLTGNDEYADKLRYNASNMNVVDDLTKPVSDFVDKNSVLGDKADEIAQGLGYVAGNTAMSILTGGLGAKLGISSKIAQTAGSMGTTFSSSMGHGMSEAYQNGATDDEAFAYGIISAAGETGSELMFGGLGKASKAVGLSKGAGELDDIVIGGLTKNIKNKMAKTLVQSGLKAGGEGAEEVVSGLISAVGKKLTYMSEEELGQILKDENLAEQFWMGALTSAIAQSPSTISSIKNRTDYITGEKYNDIQKNNAPELAQNHQNNERQQTILNDIKMPQNQNKPQLDDMLNNKELPMQKYVYEKSNNIKINNLRQDANKYFNNSEKAHNYMQMLEKIIEDKNIDIRLDANLKTPDGRTANGSYSNGVMTINPNSAKAGEFIAVHELTHAIGTKDMLNIVENYRKNNKEFNSEVERLLQNYNSTEITEEALSDVSAQLFGNQEFINNVAQNNPNIFQKIYSEIKYLWHQFRGYKNQDQFVEDLYYKWTQAYNSNNKLNETTNYHISANFSNEIDKALNNQLQSNTQVKARDYTPKILVDNGVKNLPMLITQKHIKSTIYTLQEAEKLGLPTKNVNYHGLGKDLLIKAIDNLDNPKAIYKTSENNYLVVTEFKDSSGKEIIVPIQINGKGRYNDVFIDENQIKSVYGRNKLDNYINKNNFKQIYKKNKELDFNEGIQYSNVANSSITNSIPSSTKDVNTTTKYSIQENENNAQLSEEAKKQLHRYIHMDKEQLNKVFSEVVENKENMLQEYNELSQEYKKFQNTKEFMNALENGNLNSEAWNKAGKYADKLRYYNEQYEKYKAQQEAINSLLMGNETETRSIEQVVKEAEKHFGITNNFEETAYIDINGNQIDFSGKHEGGMSGSRSLDHRQINEIDIDMQSFIDMGNIRIIPEGNGINLSVEPNEKQYAKLSKYIDNVNGEIYIDIDKTSTTYDSVEYKKGTSTSKIISDLQYYFKHGEFPKQSEFAQFRYSISKNNSKWQQYLDKNFKQTGTRTNLEDVRQIAPYKNDKNVSDTKTKIAPTKVEEKNKKKEFSDKAYFPQNFAEVTEELNNNSNAELLEQLYNDKMTLKEQKDFLTQKFVNKGHYIDQLAKKTGDKELTYKYDRMLGAQSEGQYEIGVAQTDNYGNKIGKSINEIWKPVEENKMVAEFSDYLLNKHNIDRMKAGKPIFGEEFTSAMSEKVVENYEKLYPEFKNWSKDVNTFYKNQLKNTREAGLTSAELEETLNDMYENYIIVSRAKDSDYIAPKGKTTGVNSPIKRARGGNADIQPLKDAMAKQAIAIKQAIRRNDVGLELLNVLKSVEDVNDYDVNNIVSQDKKGAYFIVFKEGKAKKIKITEGLYESLKNSQKYKIEQTMPLRAIRKFSNIQRSLLTVDNPIFMITNFFKDFQDGMFNSKYTSKFMKNYGKALSEIRKHGKYYNEYMANGGNSNTYFDYEKGVKKESKLSKFIDKIRTGNEIIEMAPRLSEYISTREAGGSINEALYNAAEITTNFKRGGDVAKALNRNGANFLNASIQGLSKQIRNLSGQNGIKGYTNLLVKATLLGVAPSMLNHLLLGDDDEYEKLPDYVKDTYYLFKIGDDKFLRIPKGRVLSIFGSAARRTLEYSEGNEEAFKGFGDTVVNQMAPNNPLSDNILAPIVQASKNETWYGGDLVPTRLQDELPENQYDESTDSFSKWLGKITGISPMKINYVLDQYSGGVGDILLPMMTPQAENNVLTDKFTIDSTLKNKNVSKFYETIEEQTRISNAPEATDEDILKTKYLSSIQSSVSDLYKEKREIQLSDLTDKVKKEEVKRIQKEINDILETGLEEYDKGDIQSNYATIGDVEYYKNKDNEWTKLTDEEKDKNKNISLETYADYKQKTYEKKVKLVENGEIKDTQSLKNKDKIQILLDSNYSNKEIKAIYENYIKSENDSEYTIINKTGINIKEYLKYKQQDFSSDSVDDGTTKGKTVSGSSKVKTYEYVNKMNITYEQRLMLLGMKYTLTDTEQTKLYNYVKSLNCTTEERQDILEKLKGFTVYKNGRVTW